MRIGDKEFRIVEKTYEDGHKEYTAQVRKSILFFRYWTDFVCDVMDYGYAKVKFICCGESYDDCYKHILETVEKHNLENSKEKLKRISIFK